MSLKDFFSFGFPFGRPMRCDAVMEVLQAYLDGEIAVEQARKVARHLDRCDGCAVESEVFAGIQRRLADRPFEIDPEIRARLESFVRSLAHDAPGTA